MSSKRALRRKACEGKAQFQFEQNAWGRCFDGMRPYNCKFCNSWHIGHVPRRVRQAIAAKRAAQ